MVDRSLLVLVLLKNFISKLLLIRIICRINLNLFFLNTRFIYHLNFRFLIMYYGIGSMPFLEA